jgi:hypothetical protein
MDRLLVAMAIVAVAAIVAAVVRHRRPSDAPTQPRHTAPSQLDRADFARPDAPWLVAVFSSATCAACADVIAKARAVESPDVAVVDVEFGAERVLHVRYAIDAVPTLVVADGAGVVHATFIGPVTATDLWAAIAEVRATGSSPEPDLGRPDTG